MENLPNQIFDIITALCTFIDQIHLKNANKILNYMVKITDLYYLPGNYLNQLSGKIIQLYPYCTQLNAKYNLKIKDIGFLSYLTCLDACAQSVID
jgi:hypothetical protein